MTRFCWGCVWFPWFCLFAAKIWSDGQTGVTVQFKLWTSVTAWLQLSFIWQAKENASLRHEGGPTQKKQREERDSVLAPLFMFFLLPLSLPYVNWASQESCLFHLSFSLRSSELPLFYLFYFWGLFPSLSFSHHYSGPLFWILTT